MVSGKKWSGSKGKEMEKTCSLLPLRGTMHINNSDVKMMKGSSIVMASLVMERRPRVAISGSRDQEK